MKLKLKPIIITSVVTFSATVALAVGLSYIPFGDKKIEASGSKNFQNEVHGAPGLPTVDSNIASLDITSHANNLDQRKASSNVIKENEKVKYVALGDSISAGFDSHLDKDYPGNYDKEKNEITGISFPTYLASFIQSSNRENNKLESYTNYASSGTTLEDWKFLLTVDDKSLKELQTKNPTKLAYYKVKFGDNLIQKSKKIKEELQKANLVTITLAANDFMELVSEKLKDPKFLENIQNIKANPTNAIANVSAAFQDTFNLMKKRIDEFSAELKKYVKTENVNFIGYPLPLPHLFVLLDGYLFKNNNSSLIVSQMAINLLNTNIQSQVTKNNFNFINSYDFDFWTKDSNINILSPTLFDIHPGSFGYKKMAQDVFIKLIVSERNGDKLKEQGINWENKYIYSDANSFSKQLEFENPFDTVKKVLTSDIDRDLFKEDDIYKKFSDKRKSGWEWYKKRVLNSSLVKNILHGAIDQLIKFPTVKNADPSSRLANFFTKNNNENLNKLKEWIDKTEFIPNFLLKSELEFQKTYWNKDKNSNHERAKLFDLVNIFKKNLLNESSLISLVAAFFNSDLIQKDKDELKNIIEDFAQNMIVQNIDEKMLTDAINKANEANSSGTIKTESLAKLVKSVLSSESVKKTIGELFIHLANNSKTYEKAKSVGELLHLALQNSDIQKIISDLASSLFDEISKEGQLSKEFTNFVFEIIKANGDIFKDIEESKLKDLLSKGIKGLKALDKEFNISKTFIDSLLPQLRGSKISDFSFANVLAQTWNKLSKNFEGKKLDESLIKIFKIVADLDLKSNKNTLEKILANSLKYFNKDSYLSKLIADKVYSASINRFNDIFAKNKFISLFDKILGSSEFSKAANSLVSALTDIDKNELDKVKTSSELIKMILTKTSVLQSNSEVINLVKKILSFDETKELVSNLIVKFAPELKDVINSENANLFISKLLANNDFQWLLEDFLVRGIFGSQSDLSNFSFENAIKSWLSDTNNNSAIIQKISSLVKSLVKDEKSLRFISDILYSQISKLPGITNDISKEEFTKLFSIISDSSIDQKDVETASNDILKKLFDDVSKDGFKFDLSKFFAGIFKANEKNLNFSSPDNFLFKIFKSVAKSEKVQENKNTTQKLLINAFKFTKQSPELRAKISGYIFQNTNKTSELVNKEDIQKLINAIFDSNEFKVIFSDLAQSIIGLNKTDWEDISSFEDLVQDVFVKFVNIKNTSLGRRANELVKSLFKKDDIKRLIAKISSGLLKSYPKITKDIDSNKLEELFYSLIGKYDDLDKIFKFENIYESLLGYLGSHIGNIDFEELSDQLKDELNRIFENSSIENTILDLAKVLVKDNFVKSHKDTLAKLVSNIFDFAESKKLVSSSITNEIINATGAAEIEKLISRDELSSLVHKLLQNRAFRNLFTSAINNLADSEVNTIQGFTTLKQLINLLANKIINSNDFELVKQLAKSLVESSEFTELVKNASKDFFEFSDSDIKALFNLLIDSPEITDLVKNFLTKGIFGNSVMLEDLSSLDLIIKSWLKDSNTNDLSEKLEKFFASVLQKDEVATIFARSSFNAAKKYGEVFENITLDEFTQFIKDLFKVLPELGQKLKLREYFVEELFEELKNNGSRASLKKVFDNYIEKLKVSLTNDQWDKNLLDLIKAVSSKSLTQNNKAMLTKLIDNTIKKVFTNENFSKDLGNKIFESSADIKTFASQSDFVNLIQKSFKSEHFQKLFKSLTDELLSISADDVNKATSVKSLLDKAVKSLASKKATDDLIKFAKEFINFDETSNILKNLLNSLGGTKGAVDISIEKIKELINYLADDKDLQELSLSLLANGFFSDKMRINDFNDYDKLIKTWLADQTVRNKVVENVKNIIKKAFAKDSIRYTYATLIYKLMKNESALIKDINEKDLIALISDSLQNYDKVSNVLELDKWFFSGVFDEIAKNGTKINSKAIEELATKSPKDKFSVQNWEKTAIDLIKSLVTTEIVLNHEDTIGQFVANIFNYAAVTKEAGSMIYDQLTKSFGSDKISKYISKDDFNSLVKSIFVKNHKVIASIMRNVTLTMKQDVYKYHNANTIADVLKIYLDSKDKIYLISKDFSVILESFLKENAVKSLIEKLLSTQLSHYKIDVNSEQNKAFFKDLLNELPSLINDLHIIPNVLNGISNGLNKHKSLTDLFSEILGLTTKSLNFEDFSFMRRILNSSTLEKHHKVLGENLKKIAEGASSDDTLVNKFIDDFGLAKLLSSKGITEQDAKDFFKSMLKSGNTKGALDLFIGKLFDDTSKLKDVDSWPKLISTLFKSVEESKAKEHIKKWIIDIVNTKDSKLFKVMAMITIDSLNSDGYKIPVDKELDKLSKFFESISKAVVGQNTNGTGSNGQIIEIFNDVIDSVFTALKELKDNDDVFTKIAEAAKNGALKFISNGNVISIAKVFDNIPKFEKLLEKVDAKSYADFINIMFKYAPADENKGLFNAIFNSEKSKGNLSLGARGFWGVIRGKVQHLISAFVTPLMKNYVDELEKSEKVYKTAQEVKENVEGYQALWRVYASLASILYSNTPSGLFWNATNLTSEAFLREGYRMAFQKAIQDKDLKKYKDNYSAVGLVGEKVVNPEFWAGVSRLRHSSTSYWLKDSYYARDYVLIYIYYKDSKDTKYNGQKTKKQALIEDLKKGFMPVDPQPK
ncbi:multifunctional lipase MilA [Mycoplasmopsis agalactiae]|uniref:multifunctional lipase MilA n=1 Tax=Mycoplasmopsis agalactiae TaxID=2110 RepID=UPI002F42FBF6